MSTPPNEANISRRRLRWKMAVAGLIIVSLALLATVFTLKSRLDEVEQRGIELGSRLGDCESRVETAQAQSDTLNIDLSNCKSQLATTEQREKTFRDEAGNAQARLISLQSSVEELKASAIRRPLNPAIIEELKSRGLKDPLNNIVADLQQHNELIPYEGWHGATMCFCFPDAISILSSQWVLAYFEDGYRCGYALLAYQVEDGGKISWKALDFMLRC